MTRTVQLLRHDAYNCPITSAWRVQLSNYGWNQACWWPIRFKNFDIVVIKPCKAFSNAERPFLIMCSKIILIFSIGWETNIWDSVFSHFITPFPIILICYGCTYKTRLRWFKKWNSQITGISLTTEETVNEVIHFLNLPESRANIGCI